MLNDCVTLTKVTLLRSTLILEVIVAYRHAVFDALILANESRAGDRPVLGGLAASRPVPAIEVFGDGAKPLDGLRLQSAIGQFLDTVGQPVFEEAAVIGRRFGLEEIAPLLLEIRYWQRLQRRNARQDGVCHASTSRESWSA